MKTELKKIIQNIKPSLFGVKEIQLQSFKKLGVGEGNLNYVFKINNVKYICRVNIESEKSDKVKREFETLQKIKKHGFSPEPIYYHNKPEFSILKFIEGKPFRHGKRTYTSKQITQIAKTLAKLHSIKTSIKPKNYNFGYYTNGALHLMNDLNKRTKNKYQKQTKQVFDIISSKIPVKETHKFSLIHGDVCPQNIVETSKEIKFIDWENVEVSDPARDIAQVMIDLGLKNENLDLFNKKYQELRRDSGILERAKVYAVLMKQNYYIWEMTRASEIKNKELPKEYLQKTSVKEHVNEANRQFNKLKKMANIKEIDCKFSL